MCTATTKKTCYGSDFCCCSCDHHRHTAATGPASKSARGHLPYLVHRCLVLCASGQLVQRGDSA